MFFLAVCKLIRDAGNLTKIAEVAQLDSNIQRVVNNSPAVQKIADACAELSQAVDGVINRANDDDD